MTSIAIVDDEQDLVEIFVDLMKIINVDVVGIGYDGKAAVELCTKHSPDFLILDLSMPQFDGFYALEKLQNTKTKIIILTGVIDDKILKKIEPFTIFSIQRKPYDFQSLTKLLQS